MRVILGDKPVRLPDEYAMRLIEQGVAEPVAEDDKPAKTEKAPAQGQAKPNGGRRARTRNAGA